MHVAILGSTGGTGRLLVAHALDRGHTVVALAREPARADFDPHERLTVRMVDVHDRAGLTAAVAGTDVVVSGLGASRGGPAGTLGAGAEGLVAAGVPAVWLTALGSGTSAARAGLLTRLVLPLVLGRAELADKARAEELLLAAGASVLAAGPLTDGPLAGARRTVALVDLPRRLFPARVSRATVAATLLDEAERPRWRGAVAVPLG